MLARSAAGACIVVHSKRKRRVRGCSTDQSNRKAAPVIARLLYSPRTCVLTAQSLLDNQLLSRSCPSPLVVTIMNFVLRRPAAIASDAEELGACRAALLSWYDLHHRLLVCLFLVFVVGVPNTSHSSRGA